MKRVIPFGKPDITDLEKRAVSIVLDSGWLGNGEVSARLEKRFEEYLGHHVHCVAVNSCTSGLILSLLAHNIGPGDEVITTPLTFSATVNAILSVGAKPVFVDVEHDGCISPSGMENAITRWTKAIIPVHLWGTPCQMDDIMELARIRKIKVIEDAAHGFGGTFKGKPLGTFGHCGVYSFYPTKNIVSGDGGLVITKSSILAERIRLIASQGQTANAWKRYRTDISNQCNVLEPGIKGLMNDLEASIVLTQLNRWPEIKEKRDIIWNVYENEFGKFKEGHSHHLYTIQVDNRDEVRKRLLNDGVYTGIHYKPLFEENAYSYLCYKQYFPIAKIIGDRTLSLPISSTMTKDDADYVVKSVKECIGRELIAA